MSDYVAGLLTVYAVVAVLWLAAVKAADMFGRLNQRNCPHCRATLAAERYACQDPECAQKKDGHEVCPSCFLEHYRPL